MLLDTRLLLWAAATSGRPPSAARAEVADPGNTLAFSALPLWEVAIKAARREDFRVEPRRLRRGLLEAG